MKKNEKDNEVSIMIDNMLHPNKPSGYMVGKVKKSMFKDTMTIDILAKNLVKGGSFCPAILEGGMGQDNWVSQQIFALDIDTGMKINEAYQKFLDLGIEPVFIYTSFSHTEAHHKFRIVFCAENEICNYELRDKLQATLMGLAEFADEKCKNRDRIFFGGNSQIILFPAYESRINPNSIIELYWDEKYERYLVGQKKKISKKKLKKAEEKEFVINKSTSVIDVINYVPENEFPDVKKSHADNAKFILGCLNRCYEDREWTQGMHRERFLFIYYNCAKMLYGSTLAYKKIVEMNDGMEEPLSTYELNSAVIHTDMHEELTNYHGDGVFVYNPSTVYDDKNLDLSDEEAEKYGFFKSVNRKLETEARKEKRDKRDREIARLYLEENMGYKQIVKELPDELKCGRSTVRDTIARLGIKERTISFDEIDFDRHAAYTRQEKPIEIAHSENERAVSKSDILELLKSKRNVALLGAGGSGKTTIMNEYLATLKKDSYMILCPTGLAASNYDGGKTIHSGLNIEVKNVYTPSEWIYLKYSDFLKNINTIVIDEIGSVRFDLFEYIVAILTIIQNEEKRKIQIIVLGDFLQLSPVLRNEDKKILLKEWDLDTIPAEGRAFACKAWADCDFDEIDMGECKRCDNQEYNQHTGEIRNCNTENIAYFDNFVAPDKEYSTEAIHLCPTNELIHSINEKIIQEEKKNKKIYMLDVETCNKTGQQTENAPFYVGMPILITKNNVDAGYYNGTIGKITRINQNSLWIQTKKNKIKITKTKLYSDDGEIVAEMFPIVPAYAISIHKAQGQRFDKAIVHPRCFAQGQLYSALSRLTSKEGLILTDKISSKDIIKNREVVSYMQAFSQRCMVYDARCDN